jgi:hypothetical protein
MFPSLRHLKMHMQKEEAGPAFHYNRGETMFRSARHSFFNSRTYELELGSEGPAPYRSDAKSDY